MYMFMSIYDLHERRHLCISILMRVYKEEELNLVIGNG